jgi:hypothetical protein
MMNLVFLPQVLIAVVLVEVQGSSGQLAIPTEVPEAGEFQPGKRFRQTCAKRAWFARARTTISSS